MRSWSWVLLIVFAIAIKFIASHPFWVEAHYSSGIYPLISKVQRAIFGWVPFSLGDVLYAFIGLIVCVKTGQLIKTLLKKQVNRHYLLIGLRQLLFFFLFLYVTFYAFWGLNYSRQGIDYQLSLDIKEINIQDADTLTGLLQQRLNYFANLVNEAERDSFNRKKNLFEKANEAFLYAANSQSFLSYTPPSIKPSLFSYAGNYLGFQGYYNAFSGEAQVNTTIPRCLEPFVTVHEIAHQLGYAKESDANFIAFIACKSLPENSFQYSMYLDLYNYAQSELFQKDSLLAISYQNKLHPQALMDFEECRVFYQRHQNPVEVMITWLYGSFLKANNQPEGKRSYSRVINFLVAYYKKYGKEAI